MLIVIFIFLAALSIGWTAITVLLLWIQAALRALICLMEVKFVRAGLWLCIALLPVSVAERESFVPLFTTIMVAAVGAAIWKLVRRYRKENPEQVQVQIEDTSVPANAQVEAAFTLTQNRDGTLVLK